MDNTNAITQLEQTLLRILKEEYSFYQSLYILLDKQRDIIQFDRMRTSSICTRRSSAARAAFANPRRK